MSFNYLYNNASRLYAVALQNDGTRLAPPKTDVEPVKVAEASENKKDKKSEESEKAASEKVKIDFDGINGRIEALPVSSGNYTILGSVEGGLLYSSEGTIMRYNLEEQKTEEIMEKAWRAMLCRCKQMLYRSGGDYGIAKLHRTKPGTEARFE